MRFTFWPTTRPRTADEEVEDTASRYAAHGRNFHKSVPAGPGRANGLCGRSRLSRDDGVCAGRSGGVRTNGHSQTHTFAFFKKGVRRPGDDDDDDDDGVLRRRTARKGTCATGGTGGGRGGRGGGGLFGL